MINHTQGPWHIPMGPGISRMTVWSANGNSLIATCTSGKLPVGECRANARLVCRAPDLLEHARFVVETLLDTDLSEEALLEKLYAQIGGIMTSIEYIELDPPQVAEAESASHKETIDG